MRRGFTLIEMMLAVTIFATVTASLGAVTIGVRRMLGRTYAEAELSVRLRGLRDKLLFHAAPPHDGKVFAGLLSGAPKGAQVVEGGAKVYVRAGGQRLGDGESFDQTIELVRAGAGTSAWFKNDAEVEPWRSRWLTLGFDGGADFDDRLSCESCDKGLYFVTLQATHDGATAGLRLAIPVFGVEQEKNATHVFHDNLLP